MAVELSPVILDGRSLTIEKVVAVARYDAPVKLSEACYEDIDRARAMVERILREDRQVYGISTGFGEFSKVTVGHDESAQLQENLILSHCVATGTPFGREIVRAMMLLRANALVRGNSGIRRELIECLIDMLNKGVTPEVPRQGSLGASGDLAPLAHDFISRGILDCNILGLFVLVDAEIISVIHNLLFGNKEALICALSIFLSSQIVESFNNVRNVVVFDSLSLIIQTETISFHVIEPDIICSTGISLRK